jgi:hypothetical protein
VAYNVERQRACAANDQELRQVVQGCHDTGCARAPQDFAGHLAEVGDGVKERHERDEQADGNRGLVEQELRAGHGKVFNLLADPDLVQSGGAECHGGDHDAKKLGLGGFVDCKADSDARSHNRGEHVARDVFAEHDEIDEDDGRGGHDLGQLVEADGVEGQGQVAENDVAGEEATDGQHVERVEADGLEGAEGTKGGDEEDEAGRGEMPHDHHELAFLDLRIAKDSVALLATWLTKGPARAYFLLRKIRPSVESVLMAIQKHVISFSLRGSGAASTTGFSM